MKLSRTLIVLDLETTGTWVDKDKIVEIAMIKKFSNGKEETFYKRVNPGIPIPSAVTELIGISNDDVKGEPLFCEIAKDVLDFIDNSDLSGFNLERFDLPLLEREINDCGLSFNWQSLKVYDVQKVYHLHEKRDLTAAYKFYCDKDLIDAHTALADTKATLEILSKQVEKYCPDDDTIESLTKFQYQKNDDFYDDERKFRWWNGKLYMMFGKYAKEYTLQ